MEKCLITKLKGVADNDSLLKMGEARIKVSKVQDDINYRMLSLEFEQPTTIYTTGEGKISTTPEGLVTNPQTSYTMQPNSYDFYFSNGDYEIHWDNKYSTIVVWVEATNMSDSGFEIDLDDFSYSVMWSIDIEGGNTKVKGSFKSLENSNDMLNDLSFTNTISHGNLNIDDLPDKMINLHIFDSNDPNMGGDIIKFKKYKNLGYIYTSGTVITGELNDLAQAQYANGRTSGTLDVEGNGIITLNGTTFTTTKRITFNKSGYVIS